MEGKLVFAYGTLRQGDCRFGISSFLKLVEPEAHLEGFQMVHLGGFPGIMSGSGRVRGEVHLYSTFDELDSIEGFREDDPGSSLFVRKEVMVEIPFGGVLQASTYTFNGDRRRRYRLIESGDWFSEHDPCG